LIASRDRFDIRSIAERSLDRLEVQLDLEPSGQTAAYVACQQRDDGADWTVRRMHCPNGHFAYQVRRRRVVRIPYMLWASAYMYVALSRLAYALNNKAAAA